MAIEIQGFKELIYSGMRRLWELERTRKGRKRLAAQYRAEAAQLRLQTGLELWTNAGGERNTHVASPGELARRAAERAATLEKEAAELDAIKGNNYNRFMA